MPITLKAQKPEEIVEVDKWPSNELAEVYPEGARDKKLMFCPKDIKFDFLIGGHKYLFKESMSRHPIQLFSEIIAYRFGCLVGVDVPPAFLAIQYRDDEAVCGALIEWFYDYPGNEGALYIRGGDLAENVIDDFDQKKGTQHNIDFITQICSSLENTAQSNEYELLHDPYEHWMKVFTFDALIGNTDRHQDNWGVLKPHDKIGFSPAFDNGTSLGYEFFDERLEKFNDPVHLTRYIKRGAHHVRWDASEDKRIPHIGLITFMLDKYPQHIEIVENILNFKEEELYYSLEDLTKFDSPICFSSNRLDFVIKLLLARRQAIKNAIGKERN